MHQSNGLDLASATSAADVLPATLAGRLNGQLGGESVVGWAEYDLNDANDFVSRHAILTDRRLLLMPEASATPPGALQVRAIDLASITSADIAEGIGMDELRVTHPGGTDVLRYTRRYRRDMTRLQRKLARRLPNEDGTIDQRPAWLEEVERTTEAQQLCSKCGEFIPAYAENICPNCNQSRRVLWRLLEIGRPYRKRIYTALALTLCHAAIMSTPGLIQKRLIDRALIGDGLSASERLSQLAMWAAVFAVVILSSEVVGGLRMALLGIVGTDVTADLRHKVYSHLHELSLRFFGKRRVGSLITRVTSDTERIWDFIAFGSVDVIRDVAMIVGIVIIMMFINWQLACVSLLPLPIVGVATYLRSKKMQRMFGRLWTYWARVSSVVGDSLGGVKVVKAFAGEGREVERFDRRNDEFTIKEQEVNKVWWTLQPTVSAAMRLGALLTWIVGGYLVIRHPSPANTIGTLLGFQVYIWQFYGPINQLANSSRMVTRASSSAQRVFEVLDTPPEIFSRVGAVQKDRLEGRVELRHVGFSYEGAQPALRDVSVTVEPGQMIGLCGQSGAGKSTFVNLLCRFYDVTDGQILIDGVDIRDYDVRWLRQQVGMVLQEPYLFHGTIAENIRYGRPEAGDREVIEAARAANAHDFIVGFPDGYDTMVGERGQSLSGGERQRVSIARAILHNPRILILDEATSSLDTETERQIQEALDRLVEGRTTIAIAHRLSTLQAADRLVVLSKGSVVEEGTHDELIARGDEGVYYKLYKTQMEMNRAMAII